MARFYGTVQGGRGEASRLGHANTGLTAYAASYSGGVRCHMYAKDDVDCVAIKAEQHGTGGRDQAEGYIYDGPVQGLKELIALRDRMDEVRAYLALQGKPL